MRMAGRRRTRSCLARTLRVRSPKRKLLTVPCSNYVLPLAALLALVIAGGASAFVVSHASSDVVQPQPSPGSCHVRGHYPFNMPDLHCTPGALNPAVTQATIHKTICRPGYSSSIRPSTSVTGPEKLASIRAYGFHQTPGATNTTISFRWSWAVPLTTAATSGRRTARHRTSRTRWRTTSTRACATAACRSPAHSASSRSTGCRSTTRTSSPSRSRRPATSAAASRTADEGVVHPGAFCSPRARPATRLRGRRWCVNRRQTAGPLAVRFGLTVDPRPLSAPWPVKSTRTARRNPDQGAWLWLARARDPGPGLVGMRCALLV